MYWLFDDYTLIFVLAGTFLGGFLPLFIMLMKCPEARQFLKCWLTGGVIISSADDSGQIEFKVAKSLGAGQYRAGKDQYGKREIYITPRINNPFITKRFMLKGIRRPLFDNYAGKTAIVNKEVLAAIEVAEEPAEVPEQVKQWALEHHITLPKPPPPPRPDVNGLASKVKGQLEKIPLFTLDPRKLKYYFAHYDDPAQTDVLLQKSYLAGREDRPSKGFGAGKMLIFILVFVVVGIVVLALALKMGWIH